MNANYIYEDTSLQEIVSIIGKLNEEIYEKTGFEDGIAYQPVEFRCTGGEFCSFAIVTFFGYTVWNSEDNERGFDEDLNEYEPLENYLRKEINTIIKTLSRIEL